jgi:translation initiation factor 2 gamma subunit (eIF-2gamma)
MLDRIFDWSFDVVMALVLLGTLAMILAIVLIAAGIVPCPQEQAWWHEYSNHFCK